MQKIEAPLIEGFILINQFLQRNHIRYCLIGGLAAGYWGEPRYTQDMDFTVISQTGKIDKILELLQKETFTVQDKGPSQLQIIKKGNLKFQADFILAETDYQDWVVQRAQTINLFDMQVPICSAEDLIILKLIANRRQDLLDIEKTLRNHFLKLDKKYLKEWFIFWELGKRYEEEFSKQFPM